MEARLIFGAKRDGSGLVSIKEAKNGIECDLICVGCKDNLIARQGEEREWHFAHENTCYDHCIESAVHALAKEVLIEEKKIFVPRLDFIKKYGGIASIDDIGSEVSFGDIRPDIIAKIYDKPVLIEICVHHEMDLEKKAKVSAYGFDCIEVMLLPWMEREDVRKALLNGSSSRWVINGEEERERQIELLRQEEERKKRAEEEARLREERWALKKKRLEEMRFQREWQEAINCDHDRMVYEQNKLNEKERENKAALKRWQDAIVRNIRLPGGMATYDEHFERLRQPYDGFVVRWCCRSSGKPWDTSIVGQNCPEHRKQCEWCERCLSFAQYYWTDKTMVLCSGQ
jgi:hypothetical protein